MPLKGQKRAPATASGALDITPDKSLIRKLGSTGYRTYEALSELVDNSLDARMSRPISIRVTLDYAKETMGVADDGAGMGLAELKDAMTLGRETNYPRGKQLGLFRLGHEDRMLFSGQVVYSVHVAAGL